MSVQTEVNYALKMLQYIRAGARLNSCVQVQLEWSEGGAKHVVEGRTMDISPKGCMVVAPKEFAVGQKMRVKNAANQKESEATLIWRGHEGRTGWELGLELVHAPADFWGVEF